MRVAFVTVNFYGHASVLSEQWRSNPQSHMFVVAFSDNEGVDFGKADRVTTITLRQATPSTNHYTE